MLVRLQYIVRRRDARKRLTSVANLVQDKQVAGAPSSNPSRHAPSSAASVNQIAEAPSRNSFRHAPSSSASGNQVDGAPSYNSFYHAPSSVASINQIAGARSSVYNRRAPSNIISENQVAGIPSAAISRHAESRNRVTKLPETEIQEDKPLVASISKASRSNKLVEERSQYINIGSGQAEEDDTTAVRRLNSRNDEIDKHKAFFIQNSHLKETKRLLTRGKRDANYTRMRALTDNISKLTPKQSDDLLFSLRNNAAPSLTVHTQNISNNAKSSMDKQTNNVCI